MKLVPVSFLTSLCLSLLIFSTALADWYVVPRFGFLQATTSGNTTRKTYSGGAYQGEGGYSSGSFFTSFQFTHALTSGSGEAGDLMSFGLNMGLKLESLFLFVGYDYRFQYSADVVAASQGNAVRGGLGYAFSPTFNVKLEYTMGTFTNYGGTKITDKQGMNTSALWFGFPFGSL